MTDPTAAIKDAAYVTVGLGVLGYQHAQVRRRELGEQLSGTGEQIEKLVEEIEQRIDPVVDRLHQRLPAGAREVLDQARRTVKEMRQQWLGWGPASGGRPTA